jgi:hypothetical protein
MELSLDADLRELTRIGVLLWRCAIVFLVHAHLVVEALCMAHKSFFGRGFTWIAADERSFWSDACGFTNPR